MSARLRHFQMNPSALEKATARLDAIIASAMDAIISVDEQQRIVLFNPAAEKMFGLSAIDAIGQPLNRFIPERYRHQHTHHVEAFGKTGVTRRRMGSLGKLSALRIDGREFPIEASISQVHAGPEKLYTVILRDVSERERAEEDLRKVQQKLESYAANLERKVAERTVQLREKVAELEAFAYSLSHDMRAPIRAIQSFSQIVLEEHGKALEHEATELLQRVVSAANRLDRLIQDVLALTGLSRQQMELHPVDLDKLVTEILAERPELQSPKAQVTIEHPLAQVQGHEASLTQSLTNLLSNAVKFVPHGIIPRVRVRTDRNGQKVRIWVEDNGIGIPATAHTKIFAIFQRLHSSEDYEGTGIGLAIVKKAIERMGGTVGLESESGEGSRFWIELSAP